MEDIGMLAPVNTLFRSYHRVKTVQTAVSRLQFGLVKCDPCSLDEMDMCFEPTSLLQRVRRKL